MCENNVLSNQSVAVSKADSFCWQILYFDTERLCNTIQCHVDWPLFVNTQDARYLVLALVCEHTGL